jgi:cell wall assembly regulator SMI1
MGITEKFQKILSHQDVKGDLAKELNPPASESNIEKIEALIKENLPVGLRDLLLFSDGQSNKGEGVFFGHQFCNSTDIIGQLQFGISLIKPEVKTIPNPAASDKLIREIVAFYRSRVPKPKLFGLVNNWYKMEFECSPGSRGGPYLYASKNTTDNGREILKIDEKAEQPVFKIVSELYELEKDTYNWDELKFTVYNDGRYDVERAMYDFNNTISFTSTPENAIRKIYFHYKWVPVFSDYSGNFIGIDMDPGETGRKGQVINFGRDEEDMVVLAESLESFFDLVLAELSQPQNRLINKEIYLHDVLKAIVK